MSSVIRSFNGIIHCVGDEGCYASTGNRLWHSKDDGGHWRLLAKLPLPFGQRQVDQLHICTRTFRWGIQHVRVIKQHVLIVSAFKRFYRIDRTSGKVIATASMVRSRPLVLCTDGNKLYFGEYCANFDRSPVNIWCSEDGVLWTVAAEIRGIRHIHGIFHDPYTNWFWITTGDQDKESIIWITRDSFQTIDEVIGGSQQLRAIQLLFTQTHVYFGSDTPLERNYIYRIDKKTGRIDKLQGVETSVFWGCKVRDFLFFSTAVEPSKVNRYRHACIWGSADGETWKCIARYRKDIWPMKLFQYGQIFFPAGENKMDYLWLTPFATEGHLTVQKLNVRRIFDEP